MKVKTDLDGATIRELVACGFGFYLGILFGVSVSAVLAIIFKAV